MPWYVLIVRYSVVLVVVLIAGLAVLKQSRQAKAVLVGLAAVLVALPAVLVLLG